METNYSTVDFRNLIKDLVDMYNYDVSEVVVSEIIANSLDAKALTIHIDYNSKDKILTIQDDGCGMGSKQFEEYHDFAAGLKKKGTGIGFAGIGAKISFNIADRVTTQTRSISFAGGSDWYLRDDGKLIWNKIEPNGLNKNGTIVKIYFKGDSNISYDNDSDLIKLIKRQYAPIFDNKFLDLYNKLKYYSSDLRFIVNGSKIELSRLETQYEIEKSKQFFLKKGSEKIGYGFIGLSRNEYSFAPLTCGILICCHGKVIKSEMFNQFPGKYGPSIFGVVEVPNLINFLTTSKNDFIKSKKQFKNFESYYNPIREQFVSWLKELDVSQTGEVEGNDSRRLERELKNLINKLPELSDFFGFRMNKSVLNINNKGKIHANLSEGTEKTFPDGKGVKGTGTGPVDEGNESGESLHIDDQGNVTVEPISRKSKNGPKIAFSDRSDRNDIAWIEGSKIVINIGHPSYKKSSKNNHSRHLYHIFAIANSIQKFINSEGSSEHLDFMFIDRMLTAWGQET